MRNKTILKQLKKANASLTQELKECRTNLDETGRALGEATSCRDSCLIALQNKHNEFEKYKAFNDRTIDYDILQNKDLKAQMQDKNIAISELKKLIEKCKGKSVETQSTTQQNLPQNRKQAEIHSNVLKPGMYRIATTTTQNREPQLPHASRNTNPHVSKSSGVNHTTSVSRPQLKCYQVKDKVVPNNSQVKFKRKEVKDHHSISKKTKSVTACNDSSNSRTSNVNAVCAKCGKCVFISNHDACVSKYLNDVNARTKKPKVVPISASKPKRKANKSVATPHKKTIVQLILFIVDSGCTKHMTGNLKLLCNFVEKFLGTVRFGNDQFAPILGYGDLNQGNVTIKRVYYVEGLNHNLFSVGQFCDADLEVAFRISCFVRDLQEMITNWLHQSSMLWHEDFLHLNSRITSLYSQRRYCDRLNKLKYVKDQLCSSCEMSKAKRSSFKSKAVPSSKGRLNLLHMDLCDGENLDKMKEKGDPCVMVGYSTQSKGYRVYNKRTRLIVESIHIKFDEIKEMMSDHNSSDLAPQRQEMSIKNVSSGLVPQGQKASDYDNSDPHTVMLRTTTMIKHRMHHFKKLNLSILFVHSHDYRWTRDHPLEQVHGNPTMPVQTRRQLATDPEMCMFALTVSIVEPKNIKEAMADSAWIEAMQDELHQFDRLKVWELVDKPFGKMIIKTKVNFICTSCCLGSSSDLFVAYAAHKVFSISIDDVKTTFLRVTEEEVYVASKKGLLIPDFQKKSTF
ncbi:retrovirus-related pol polyprotein from transposon TNT 1-94 [Tanacetum coccineum]